MNGGQFASDTTQVIFDSEELTGGDRWYEGSASKEIKITLKEYVDTHTGTLRIIHDLRKSN